MGTQICQMIPLIDKAFLLRRGQEGSSLENLISFAWLHQRVVSQTVDRESPWASHTTAQPQFLQLLSGNHHDLTWLRWG